MAVNFKQFKEALEEIESSQGISEEETINAFKESLLRSFRRKLGGDDAHVELNFDPDNEILELYYIKDVVKEVEDDFLQIDIEEANNDGSGKVYKEGDLYYIPYQIDSLDKNLAISVKSNVHQRLTEVEKQYLLETFKDKIDTLITGVVEKVDDFGIDVNVGKATVHLTRKDLIGDERFSVGDYIKVYVVDVDSASKGGAKIRVSRTHPGFLRCLFFEEIHEVYDGTIKIQNIARKAGERSKVAVYSLDPNVDPAGACIGPNGARIQKIVSQLGNNASTKEKIDIIDYSSNIALYIIDSLKPALILGLALSDDNKSATAVVRDDSLSLAIGKKGVNVRLASELTGVDINVVTETQAYEDNLEYKTFEQISAEELQRKKEEPLFEGVPSKEDVLPTLPEGYVAPQERVYEEEKTDIDASLYEEASKEEVTNESPLEESLELEEAPTQEKEETIQVKTTTTLEDLEKSLETEKKETTKKTTKKSVKKEEEKTEEAPVFTKDESNYMPIYSEEELEEIEQEEALENEEEDIDYDEYAEYYEDQD